MPELPEVETIVNGLRDNLVGKTIIDCKTSRKKLRADSYDVLEENIIGNKFLKLLRRGKYIIANLNNNHSLIIHLGMSGKLILSKNYISKKHDHVSFELSNGDFLTFNDARRFGCFIYDKTDRINTHPLLSALGIEPLTNKLSTEVLIRLLTNKKTTIKNFLMNSKNIVGVGNIYASEALFHAKVHPLRICSTINENEASAICLAIKNVLSDAIKSGGSTLRDYVRSDGDLGYFQHKFNVYGKNGQPCNKCKQSIEKMVIAGRSTFCCINCQK